MRTLKANPRHRFAAVIISALLFVFFIAETQADTIFLRNGRRLDGIIKKEDAKSIELEMGGGSVTINKSEVIDIKRLSPAEAEKMKRDLERKKQEMAQQEDEFSKQRNKRFSEYSQWQDKERSERSDRTSESKDIQAAKDLKSGGIIVEAIINNNVKAVLLVDTGASVILLSKKTAAALGIDLTDTKKEIIECVMADGSKVKAKTVILESVSVQGAEEKNVRAAVPLDEVQGINIHDGLLGMSYLSRFNINIDRATMKISLEKTGKK